MSVLRVFLRERSYPVFIGKGLLKEAGRLIKNQNISKAHAVVVSQKEIASLYYSTLLESLLREGFESSLFLTPLAKSSEAAKSQGVFWKLIKAIASYDGRNRPLFLIALGGGVIGDLTGFAAAVYRRGIPYIQIPTTLTAQVDSAIGGKTGIDLPEGKNLLGVIYQPRGVLSDISVLASLPDRHWSDGFAEVIKCGVIKDAALFSLLEAHGKEGILKNSGLLEKAIVRSARIKTHVVEKDELDKKDLRIILNFGHTAGHAIETASRFSRLYTHGEAVGIGMLVACHLSKRLGVLRDEDLPERLEKTLIKFNLPLFYKGLALDAILKAIGYDKKREGGANRFILPVSLGKVTVVKDIPLSMIIEALEKRKG